MSTGRPSRGFLPNVSVGVGMALQSDRLAVGLVALGIVAVAFLYSVFVMRAPLQLVGLLGPVVFLYLLWRFVRAHERIADAMEASGRQGDVDRVE